MPFSCELMPFTAVKTRFTRSPSPLSQVLNYPLELKHSKTRKKKFCPIMYCRSFPFFKTCTEHKSKWRLIGTNCALAFQRITIISFEGFSCEILNNICIQCYRKLIIGLNKLKSISKTESGRYCWKEKL